MPRRGRCCSTGPSRPSSATTTSGTAPSCSNSLRTFSNFCFFGDNTGIYPLLYRLTLHPAFQCFSCFCLHSNTWSEFSSSTLQLCGCLPTGALRPRCKVEGRYRPFLFQVHERCDLCTAWNVSRSFYRLMIQSWLRSEQLNTNERFSFTKCVHKYVTQIFNNSAIK